MKKNSAFTLAETLLVLGIIGIIAVFVTPMLTDSIDTDKNVMLLKRQYENINTLVNTVYIKNSPKKLSDSTSNEIKTAFTETFEKYAKVSKTCTSTVTDCIEGDTDLDFGFVFSDGSSIGIKIESVDDANKAVILNGTGLDANTSYLLGDLYVDIDGPNKGENTAGSDIFAFYINDNGIVPFGYDLIDPSTGSEANDVNYKKCFSNRLYCTAWVIDKSNMDYADADSNGKCNTGTKTLDWTSNSTCK